MTERVRVTVEMEKPQGTALEDCARLVLHQMKAAPEWHDRAGTGLLNYVCYDRTLRIVGAEIIGA